MVTRPTNVLTRLTARRAVGVAASYLEYRRSDALALRLLSREPMAIGALGDALGVTRQAARKVANGLQRRGFARATRDTADARQVNLSLTPQGEAYADAVQVVIERLNLELTRRVDAADLATADMVLRAILTDEHTRALAARLAPPHLGHDSSQMP